MNQLRLPKALKMLLANDALSDFRYLYWLTRRIPEGEPALQDIAPLIKPTDIVVEVGAAAGGGTLILSSLARRVYAFEPNRHSYRVLRHFTKNRRNVTALNFAVGANQGIARLNLVAGEATSQGSSIGNLDGLKYEGHQNVRMVDLDGVSFPLKPSVLIIDCEGYEVEVLDGGRRTLDSARAVFVEVHTTRNGGNTIDDVVSRLKEAQMTTSVFYSGDKLPWVSGTREQSVLVDEKPELKTRGMLLGTSTGEINIRQI